MSESKYFFTGDLIKDDIKKIPKFDTGGICNDAMFSKNYFYSQIDEIAKDIRNRKDNAIAMEFTKCIGELLKKNGVTPKINECTANLETDKHFKVRYGVTIDELDFSEHDKVFENEIAGLKAKIAIKDMDYKTASELLCKYQQENEGLKQRISELESKETETCEKEPISDDCRPSMEWYENRHQSDCIEINRLNTTIDVLIHKIEYLRQFAGLE